MKKTFILLFLLISYTTSSQDKDINIDYSSIPQTFTNFSENCIALYDTYEKRPIYIPAKISFEELEAVFSKKADIELLFAGSKYPNEQSRVFIGNGVFIGIALRNNTDLLMVYTRFSKRFTLNECKPFPWEKEYLYRNFGKPFFEDHIQFISYKDNIYKNMRFELDKETGMINGVAIYGKEFKER